MDYIDYHDKADGLDVDQHVSRCREYSRRKRAILVKYPNMSPTEYERQIKRIQMEIGL